MMKQLFATIFGVPRPPSKSQEPQKPQPYVDGCPLYLPASALDPDKLDAVQPDGSVWEPWRIEKPTGELWYRRISDPEPGAANANAPRRLLGIAPDDGGYLPPIEDYSSGFDLEELPEERKTYVASVLLAEAQKRIAARQLERRNDALELPEDFYDGEE